MRLVTFIHQLRSGAAKAARHAARSRKWILAASSMRENDRVILVSYLIVMVDFSPYGARDGNIEHEAGCIFQGVFI